MFWKTLGRILLIPIAFLLSALASITVLLTLALEQLTQMLHTTTEDSQAAQIMVELFMTSASILPALTLIPALLIIIIGEVARIRSALYYIIGGGAALAAIPILASVSASAETASTIDPQLLGVFATAGFAGGLFYWLIAGRNA